MTTTIDDRFDEDNFSSEGNEILDRIIEQEQLALMARVAAAAATFNGCTLRFLVDDGGTTAFTAGMQISENADGSLTIKVAQVSGPKGDIVGLGFSFSDKVDATKLAYLDASKTITGMQTSAKENLDSFGGANYMNFHGTKMAFDALFLVGTNGIAADDIQSVSFTLYSKDGTALHASDLTEAGVRTQSIGDVGARAASDKDWEKIAANACFELRSDYVLPAPESAITADRARYDLLAEARLADPLARYDVLSFTVDGTQYAAGGTAVWTDVHTGLQLTLSVDKAGTLAITGDATSLDAGRIPSTLLGITAQKTTGEAISTATADIVVTFNGEESVERIEKSAYSFMEDSRGSVNLAANVSGDYYDSLASRMIGFRIAEAQITSADGTVTLVDPGRLAGIAFINKAGQLTVDATGAFANSLNKGDVLEMTANYRTVTPDGEVAGNIGVTKLTITGLNDTPTAAAVGATALEGRAFGSIYDWLAKGTDADSRAVLDFYSIGGYQVDRATLLAMNSTKVVITTGPAYADQISTLLTKAFNGIFGSDGGAGPEAVQLAQAYYAEVIAALNHIKEAMGDVSKMDLKAQMDLFSKYAAGVDYITDARKFIMSILDPDSSLAYAEAKLFDTFKTQETYAERTVDVIGSKVFQLEHGILEIFGNGNYALTLAADDTGGVPHKLDIAYVIQDEHRALSNEGIVSFANNNSPTAFGDFISVALGGTVRFNLTANDKDANNDILTLTDVNGQRFICDTAHDTFDRADYATLDTSTSRIAIGSDETDRAPAGDAGGDCTNTFRIGAVLTEMRANGEGYIDTSGLAAIVNEAYRVSFWEYEVPPDQILGNYTEFWGHDQNMFTSILSRYGVALDAETGDISASFTYGIADGYGGMARASANVLVDVPDFKFSPAKKGAIFTFQTDTATEQQVGEFLNPSDVWAT